MYQSLAKNYDRFNNWEARLAFEMPFIISQLQNLFRDPDQSISILDAACGTGMHAIHLAKAGFEVAGADLFDEMITKAKANAHQAGLSVDFRSAGFSTLATEFAGQRFDALLCLGNSLPHVLTADAVMQTLQEFKGCLKPGGLLLLQNRNFDSVMQMKNRWLDPQAYQDESGEWVFQRFYDFEPDGLIRFTIITLQRQPGQAWQATATDTMLRPQISQELVSQLDNAGFQSIQTYGDLSGNPFEPGQSPNLVIITNAPRT